MSLFRYSSQAGRDELWTLAVITAVNRVVSAAQSVASCSYCSVFEGFSPKYVYLKA